MSPYRRRSPRIGSCLCALLLGLGSALAAHAGVVDTPSEDLEVSLITYGPGAIYWERFGHDAIQIRDRVSGESVDFNYGVFDFEERGFMWNFARGLMHYMIDAERSDMDEQDYIAEGRSVVAQRLALTAAQAASLRAFLLWNLRPGNAVYNYDYLTNNCATRVRDALNATLGGALRRVMVARPAPMTYREQIDRLMSAQPWLMLAMDFALGPSADRALNEWQESFLPFVLASEVRRLRIPDGRGGSGSLVLSEHQIAANRLTPPPESPPNLDVPLGLAGLLLAGVMFASRRQLPALHVSLATTYLIIAGVAGTLLLGAWTLTMHRAAWGNANVLVFNPLAFAMLPSVWRTRHGAGGTQLARALVALQLGAAVLAVLLHVLPGTAQQNLPWLLFAIPVWLAVADGLRAREAKVCRIELPVR
ncbi:MAG: DUF4105 domain-containing protein [Steroidobacteraceae bacterium]